jgi:hypothetical protein
LDRFSDALLELEGRAPAEFVFDFGGVNGIAAVMAGAIFDVGDEFAGISPEIGT